MHRPTLYTLLAAALVLVAGSTDARADAQLAGYGATGDVQSCLDERQVKHTIILDDATVIFRLHDGSHYVNRLPEICEGLMKAAGISYSSSNAAGICAQDIIFASTFCALGVFERLEPQTVQEAGTTVNSGQQDAHRAALAR